MRVIAGTARSLPLHVPEGNDVRPTIDRYKETVFNIVMPYVAGGMTLDIFSGSGSIGVEALSRGAKEAYFVENSGHAMRCIEYNLQFTKLFEKATLLKYDYNKALMMLRDRKLSFDLIYMDPPYDHDLEEPVVELIKECNLLREDGILVIESSHNTDMSFLEEDDRLDIVKSKSFKSCQFTFIKLKQ